MRYTVTYVLYGQYSVDVEANNIEEAEYKADLKFQKADFGKASDINGRIDNVKSKGGVHYEL